jgi:hypothetical protein
MAWPPPTLPINRTDANPQQGTHPSDHNALALAINDTVAFVQQMYESFQTTFLQNGKIERGVFNGALDALSAVQINYPAAFGDVAVPYCAYAQAGGADTALPVSTVIVDRSATHFSVRVLDSQNNPMAGATLLLVWTAVGAWP